MSFSPELYAINFAYEGVPVGAIARALHLPSEQIREVLQVAINAGSLTEMPRSDWPPNVMRADRLPGLSRPAQATDDAVLLNLVRLFKITPQQALLLLILLKRREVTRDQMHQAIESRRSGEKEETDRKIVDVVICKLRKRLTLFDLEIETLWAWGYAMHPEHRKKVIQLLNEFMELSEDAIKVGP